MERRTGPRIYGPYEHGDQYRVHVVTSSGGRRTTSYHAFATRALAQAFIDGAKDQAQGTTVTATVEAFLARKREQGRAESTVESDEDRLAMILGPVMSCAIRSVLGRG